MTIKYLDLKKEYTKVHRKIPRKQLTPELKAKASWMRIKEGGVKILVEAQNLDGELIAKVVVQRERAAFAEVGLPSCQKRDIRELRKGFLC